MQKRATIILLFFKTNHKLIFFGITLLQIYSVNFVQEVAESEISEEMKPLIFGVRNQPLITGQSLTPIIANFHSVNFRKVFTAPKRVTSHLQTEVDHCIREQISSKLWKENSLVLGFSKMLCKL